MTVPTRLAVGAALTRADIPALCAGLAELLRGRAGDAVICDVSGVTRPDAVTVEALARLRMTARRHGRRMVVAGAHPGLLDLVRLFGLADELALAGELALADELALAGELPLAGGSAADGGSAEAGRQPEQREQAGGVEEVVDGRDPPGGDLQHDERPRLVP
jgi:ABC-type transporter Mla MlaB component